jgi:DNA-nicking Smr family endonuclease
VPRKRDLHEDERALWEAATRDVRRYRGAAPKPAKAAQAKQNPAPAAPLPVPAKPRRSSAPAFGIDGATAERLRRGKVEPDATIDLHGLTQAQAHARLATFVRRGSESGRRCLLVITGKGSPREDGGAEGFAMPERSKAGVLRLMVPRWLEELSAVVVGVQSAHRRHGGAGALYVYLRRKRGRD